MERAILFPFLELFLWLQGMLLERILFMIINRLIDLVSTMHLRAVHFLQPL